MRRMYELHTFGASKEPITLGDEDNNYFAPVPKPGTHAPPAGGVYR